MAHLDSRLLRRIPLSCVTQSGVAANETYDIPIPAGLDDFWAAIDNAGDEVRCTAADGVTPVDYGWRSFTKSSKDGTISLENVATGGTADRLLLFWLYYKLHPDETLTDGSTTLTAKDDDGFIELSRPSTYVVGVRPQPERATTPRAAFAKSTADEAYVWLDVQGLLEPAARLWNGRPYMEEPGRTAVQVLDSSGTPVPSMTDASGLRWGTYRRRGERWERSILRVPILGGVDGETYAIECQFETAHPSASGAFRTLAPRVGFRVQDLLET